jgi:hypothetical protein
MSYAEGHNPSVTPIITSALRPFQPLRECSAEPVNGRSFSQAATVRFPPIVLKNSRLQS